VYNIDNKFDGGACAYKKCQQLPVTVYDLRSYSWSTGDSWRSEVEAEVVSRSDTAAFAMVALRYSGPKPFSTLLKTSSQLKSEIPFPTTRSVRFLSHFVIGDCAGLDLFNYFAQIYAHGVA